jgi:hypothetical protein
MQIKISPLDDGTLSILLWSLLTIMRQQYNTENRAFDEDKIL